MIEPQPLQDQKSPFRYPVDMWDKGMQAEVVILLLVNRKGAVDSTMIFHSSGNAMFDAAALEGGLELKFVPGRRGTHLLERWVKVPVRFNRDSTAALDAINSGQ
jgi:TonB family protein